jgi:hypothetical protein
MILPKHCILLNSQSGWFFEEEEEMNTDWFVEKAVNCKKQQSTDSFVQ